VTPITDILLTLCLAVPARPQPAETPVIAFARSGQNVTLAVPGDRGVPAGPVAILAYGRLWGESADANHGTVKLVAPAVRAPIVFRVVRVSNQESVLGEMVVYPEGWIAWEMHPEFRRAEKTQLVAVGVPDWFHAWLEAVGLPVERLPGPESLAGRPWRKLDKSSLLIVGQKAAGSGPAEMGRLAVRYRTNLLVLEADWFGDPTTPPGGIAVLPKDAAAALADLRTQQWPLPPHFCRYATPWPGIANRLAWIDGNAYPLVEEIHPPQEGAESLRIVLSYLPWQDQLGRCAAADELLLRLLAEAARGAEQARTLDGRWRLLYPAAGQINVDQRPVLAAASKAAETAYAQAVEPAATAPRGVRGYVLDLRGGAPPSDLLHRLDAERTFEPRIDKATPLLILGDHPILDAWRWLRLDRQPEPSTRPGVIWWPEDSLPSSPAAELRLMKLFTEWNVFLGETPPGAKQ